MQKVVAPPHRAIGTESASFGHFSPEVPETLQIRAYRRVFAVGAALVQHCPKPLQKSINKRLRSSR